jgi:hypothetical protein
MYQYLSSDHEFVPNHSEDDIASVLIVHDKQSHAVVSIQGVTNERQLGVLFDNILGYWSSIGMGAIIPFFGLLNDLFLAPVLSVVLDLATDVFLGLASQTVDNVNHLAKYVDEYIKFSGFTPVVTGHMSGGVYAKGIASSEVCSPHGNGSSVKCYGVAFESPQSYGSTLTLVSLAKPRGSPHISNVYSDSSFFSMIELQTNQNVYLPSYQSYVKPANPYETFCHIAAGCVMDDRYDHLCSAAVGGHVYVDYFKKWGRERGNLTSVGSPDNSMVQMAWGHRTRPGYKVGKSRGSNFRLI